MPADRLIFVHDNRGKYSFRAHLEGVPVVNSQCDMRYISERLRKLFEAQGHNCGAIDFRHDGEYSGQTAYVIVDGNFCQKIRP